MDHIRKIKLREVMWKDPLMLFSEGLGCGLKKVELILWGFTSGGRRGEGGRSRVVKQILSGENVVWEKYRMKKKIGDWGGKVEGFGL